MFKWNQIGISADLVILICIGLILLLFVIIIVALVKNSSLRKRLDAFMGGSDGKSLESAFQKKFENMDYVNAKLVEIDNRLDIIDRNLLITFQKYSVIKYDAFDVGGGKLSFVMTLLTKENNGFIINTVHSNSDQGYFSYLKEVRNGVVDVELAAEERLSLEQALAQ